MKTNFQNCITPCHTTNADYPISSSFLWFASDSRGLSCCNWASLGDSTFLAPCLQRRPASDICFSATVLGRFQSLSGQRKWERILLSTDGILQRVTPPLTLRFSTALKSNFSFFGGKECALFCGKAVWRWILTGGGHPGNDWSVAAKDPGGRHQTV